MKSSPLSTAVALARALGHPARMRTLAMLRSGELCVCQITEVLGLAPSTVSAHLRELKRCGLTRDRKQGRWVFVELTDDDRARPWADLAVAAAADDPRLAEDARMVARLRRVPVEDLCRLGYQAAVARAERADGGSEHPGGCR